LRTAEPPLIPVEKIEDFFIAAESKNFNSLKIHLESISSYQYQVLKKLFIFLTKVIDKSSQNLMDLRNVSIVFSPAFIPNDILDDFTGTLAYLQSQKKIVVIVECFTKEILLAIIHASNTSHLRQAGRVMAFINYFLLNHTVFQI